MASSSISEEKGDGNIEEVGEQDQCLGETSSPAPQRPSVVRQRAKQYWQQLRRFLPRLLTFALLANL